MGVIWGTGSGEGPWVMADLENGLYPGWANGQDQGISTNTSLRHDFVTAVLVGDTADKNDGTGRFALYGGDATSGTLTEMYDGIRPEKPGYAPMQKQGSVVLSIAGDNSDGDGGRFYEGVMVTGAASRETANALQTAIVAARYGAADTVGHSGGTGGATGAGGSAGVGGTPGGTGGGTATCTNVTPCGGDVVGTWNVTSSCLTVSGELDLSGLGLGCSYAPVTGSLDVTGTWTADADGTYSDNTITTGTETLELPGSCLSVSGTCTTCSRLGGPIMAVGYASVTCEDNPNGDLGECGAGCTCTASVDQAGGIGLVPMYPSANGAYTTAGSVLTVNAGEQEYSYCVSGSTLTLTPQSVGRTGTLTGTVELQQQ
jgi:hypothetical protein